MATIFRCWPILATSGLRNAVRLIYIDPPFDSNADYTRKVRLRNDRSQVLGQQVQYSDTWAGDSYLQFMYERLLLLRDLLADDGSIWLHCDYRQVHRLHLLLEEVFGEENYLNTISWRSQVTRGAKVNAFYFPFSTQYIEIFAKNRSCADALACAEERTGLHAQTGGRPVHGGRARLLPHVRSRHLQL